MKDSGLPQQSGFSRLLAAMDEIAAPPQLDTPLPSNLVDETPPQFDELELVEEVHRGGGVPTTMRMLN